MVKRPDRTVADWIAEGETTIALLCIAKDCGHRASMDISGLPPETTRSQIIRRARCSACGPHSVQFMRDMDAHYRQTEERGFNTEYLGR